MDGFIDTGPSNIEPNMNGGTEPFEAILRTQMLPQIWELRMRENGTQRYMDQFKLLAMKLEWNLQEEAIIYQFKTGLLQLILT